MLESKHKNFSGKIWNSLTINMFVTVHVRIQCDDIFISSTFKFEAPKRKGLSAISNIPKVTEDFYILHFTCLKKSII
jgi:hypothetical protein